MDALRGSLNASEDRLFGALDLALALDSPSPLTRDLDLAGERVHVLFEFVRRGFEESIVRLERADGQRVRDGNVVGIEGARRPIRGAGRGRQPHDAVPGRGMRE